MERTLIENKRESMILGAQMSLILIFVTTMVMLCGTIGAAFLLIEKTSAFATTALMCFYLNSILSIIFGANAINIIRGSVFNGKWDLDTTHLNMQVKMILVAGLFYLLFVTCIITA